MDNSYELAKLDPSSFEHLVNLLALRVLGAGHTGFGPGSDGGRDGYFEGEAPYPSEVDRWSGRWYIQSKFHKPHLSKDPQKWLLEQISAEVKAFKDPDSRRKWPDNWIIATNVDPSGSPETGSFDRANKLVSRANKKVGSRFHIWGGRKILDLLAIHNEVSAFYKDFLTPGHIFTDLYEHMHDERASLDTVLHYLIGTQFVDQQHTKLEQAGSEADSRPGIHKLFIDLPFRANESDLTGMMTEYLIRTAGKCHRINTTQADSKEWRLWSKHPSRSRVWFVKGGPGQGKSTSSQYFSQIQRAALILQDDCFPVVPQYKSLAREVQQAAETNGIWPTTPRIPITVELRDYAQWFGQQSKYSARGVLTYIAARLSVRVEQQVEVGLIKRALGMRSWFIAFDGLDEVPHDVKDALAEQVLYFLNDVAVKCNSDLLAVCTSRPQGYSGQFSELDGPTIDLLSLSPEQALACAKPVLELGRSSEESNKYIQILKSAIESGSVRELMTTPLQSHIMAVVVRGGGKPPERRWQLYCNFYEVIRKREANRDLPDKRLAKLLRDDTQLLKTVHNRLGFVLHAQAETSRGAQTHLSREEFRKLVANAVSQMIENDQEATVEVLMNATTDRLVLVNTPDAGNFLRFDIRPLQEFFAAEFVYESVSAEEFRQRIEVFSGDAHWREVMHFLLSALVENGRRTELTVAVEALNRENNGTGEGHARLLARRMGRGVFLTGRILQEGVLEQDRRVRQQFRGCLEPLGAFVDWRTLWNFYNVDQPSSKAWLIGFLVDCLREYDHSENIGAMILLLYKLCDNDSHVLEVQNYILAAPQSYVSCALNARIKHFRDYGQSLHVERWVADTVLKLLLRPQWALLGYEGVRAARNLLLECNLSKDVPLKEIGLSEIESGLLDVFLTSEWVGQDSKTSKYSDYGLIRGMKFENDWTCKTFSAPSWWPTDDDGEPKVEGVLKIVFRILRFAKNRLLSDLKAIFECVDKKSEEAINALPSHILAFLPLDNAFDSQSYFGRLRSLTETEFSLLIGEAMLDGRKIAAPYMHLVIRPHGTSKQWTELIDDLPNLAMEVWADPFFLGHSSGKRPTWYDEPENVCRLINKCFETPSIFWSRPHLWGMLFKKCPSKESELRSILVTCGSLPVSDELWIKQFYPFALNLPGEQILLPNIVNGLSVLLEGSDDGSKAEIKLKGVRSVVKELVFDIEVLKTIANDHRALVSVRAAAILLAMMHPDGQAVFREFHLLLGEFGALNVGRWYYRAVRVCIGLLVSDDDDAAKSLVGALLESARDDYTGRIELQKLLTQWCEISHAPISSAHVLDKWLSGC